MYCRIYLKQIYTKLKERKTEYSRLRTHMHSDNHTGGQSLESWEHKAFEDKIFEWQHPQVPRHQIGHRRERMRESWKRKECEWLREKKRDFQSVQAKAHWHTNPSHKHISILPLSLSPPISCQVALLLCCQHQARSGECMENEVLRQWPLFSSPFHLFHSHFPLPFPTDHQALHGLNKTTTTIPTITWLLDGKGLIPFTTWDSLFRNKSCEVNISDKYVT